MKVGFERQSGEQLLQVGLSNLMLQGCGFENGKLCGAAGNQEMIELPIIYLSFALKVENSGDVVELGLFNNLNREKLICKLILPNSGSDSERIISGSGILLNE